MAAITVQMPDTYDKKTPMSMILLMFRPMMFTIIIVIIANLKITPPLIIVISIIITTNATGSNCIMVLPTIMQAMLVNLIRC